MAQKKITELQAISSISGSESFPVDDGIQTYRGTPSQMYDYIRGRIKASQFEISNLSIESSVGSSALTIAIKTLAAANPSSTDPIRVAFRNATLTSGYFNLRQITSALSLVISSGSTLGQVSAQPSYIWVYLIDNAGSPELAVSHSKYPEDSLVSTTAEGGAGAADSTTVIYSTSARSSVPIRLIGYILNTQTTAGTWASAGTEIQLLPQAHIKKPTIQKFTSSSGTYLTPAGCTRINVRGISGGGGGAGSGTTTTGGAGGAGGTSTFGTLSASGGGGGVNLALGSGGSGGVVSGSPNIVSINGSLGSITGPTSAGGGGGISCFGGAGIGGFSTGGSAIANSGSGGGGGGYQYGANPGNGGGAGGYFEHLFINPDASYAYAVGGGGSFGAAGSGANAANGGSGGSGVIIVEEFYD